MKKGKELSGAPFLFMFIRMASEGRFSIWNRQVALNRGVHSVFTRLLKNLSPPLAGGDEGEGENSFPITLSLALSHQGRGKR
jgi:hypothetical protein